MNSTICVDEGRVRSRKELFMESKSGLKWDPCCRSWSQISVTRSLLLFLASSLRGRFGGGMSSAGRFTVFASSSFVSSLLRSCTLWRVNCISNSMKGMLFIWLPQPHFVKLTSQSTFRMIQRMTIFENHHLTMLLFLFYVKLRTTAKYIVFSESLSLFETYLLLTDINCVSKHTHTVSHTQFENSFAQTVRNRVC